MFCQKCGFQFEGKFCPQCGQTSQQNTGENNQAAPIAPISPQSYSTYPTPPSVMPGYVGNQNAASWTNTIPKPQASMQIAKLIIGILSIIFSIWIFFQSVLVGALSGLAEMDDLGGAAGIFMSVCWLVAGITGIAGRKSKAAAWVSSSFFVFSAVMGISNMTVFSDLGIYSCVAFGFTILFGLSAVIPQKQSR